MRRHIGVSMAVVGVALIAARPAFTQTTPDATTIDLDVTAKRLDLARSLLADSGVEVHSVGGLGDVVTLHAKTKKAVAQRRTAQRDNAAVDVADRAVTG